MDRRAFLRLVGIGLAVGPEAIAEAMKPQVFYSIPASLGTHVDYIPLRYMYGRIRLSAQMMRDPPPLHEFMAQELEGIRRDIIRQTWSLA